MWLYNHFFKDSGWNKKKKTTGDINIILKIVLVHQVTYAIKFMSMFMEQGIMKKTNVGK